MQLVDLPTPSRRAVFVSCLAIAALGVGAAVRHPNTTERDLTAAVTADGFAVLDGAPADRHVVTVDRDGASPERRAVPVIAPSARMVGTSRGVSIAWQDADKVRMARVTGDGTLGEATQWGKRVVQLCDGIATSADRWGIGWLEKDGRVWILHGPVRTSKRPAGADGDDTVIEAAAATRTTWCGVTSAGAQEALMWRDGSGRMFLNLCDAKKCSDTVVRLPVGAKQQLDGIACTERACLAVVRDGADRKVGWWKIGGKVVWSKPVSDALPDTTFALTAAGDQAFAIGYVAREGATVSRVIESGSMVRAWADPYAQATPALAWAKDRLLVAHRHEATLSPEVVPLPR